MSESGWVFDIQHFSTHDGPGIRTIVFLQGCPLKCRWCHNPESWSQKPILAYTASRCTSCGRCVSACPTSAHSLKDGRHQIDRSVCSVCGKCVQSCPSKALEIVGRKMPVESIIETVMCDYPFYEDSGGGLTLSGGETLMQADFSRDILSAAKGHGVNTCVETCGFGNPKYLLGFVDFTDLFLFDIKHTDDCLHKKYTGVSNKTILANLNILCNVGAPVRLRLPWVPEVNDTISHIEVVSELFHGNSNIESVEIVPYHSLGNSKACRLGETYGGELFREPEEDELAFARREFKSRGVSLHAV